MDEGERGFSADGGRGHRTPRAEVGIADVGMASRRNGRRFEPELNSGLMDEGERGSSSDGGRGHRTPQAKVGGADVGMTSRRNGRRKARHFLSAKLGGCKEETPNGITDIKCRANRGEWRIENGEIAQG